MKQISFAFLVFISTYVSAQTNKRFVVAADGSGNYKTVQAAFDAVPVNNNTRLTIFVKNGLYKEKIHLDSGKNFVDLVGESKFNTILTYDDHPGKVTQNGQGVNTRNSYSFLVSADNFTAGNVTFRNDAGFTAGQAVAVEVRGDKAVFTDCRFIGNQDILFLSTENGRQYFKDCYIEGTTDFIFGSATAWFEGCHIHSKKNSHITAASTPQYHPFGFVFHDCVLTGDSALHKVSLGRPWRPYSSVIYIDCYIDKHIMPDGWANWNTTESYKTARYAEYQNYGPGAAISGRVPWSRQLTAAEVADVNIKKVFITWTPQ